MRKLAGLSLAAALALTGAAVWDTGAEAGDLYRFKATSHGRGVNHESGQLPVTAGLATSVTRYVLEAGSSFGWHHHENDAPAIIIILSGAAVEYSSCTEKTEMVPGRTYLHRVGHHSHPTLLRNEGTVPVEMEVIYFDESAENPSGIDGRPDTPPAECPTLF